MLAVQGAETPQAQIQNLENNSQSGITQGLVESKATTGQTGLSQSIAANDSVKSSLATSNSASISEALNAPTESNNTKFPGKNWIEKQIDKLKHNIEHFVETAFEKLLDGTANTLVDLQDEAQAVLDGYHNMQSDFEDFQQNAQNIVDMLPSWLEKPAQAVLDGLTNPVENVFDTLDNSLGKKVLGLIADSDKLTSLLGEVTDGFDGFDNNPIDILKGILGPFDSALGNLFDPTYSETHPYSEYALAQDPEALQQMLREYLILPLATNNPDGIKESDITDDLFMADVNHIENITADRLDGQLLPEGEQWFYINGVATTEDIGVANATQLSDMFGRSIDLLHNPCDSIITDVLECGVDKSRISESEPVQQMYGKILEALETEDKVVITTHSQGSLITDAILEKLDLAYQEGSLSEADLSKLEIYTFANPATNMKSPVNDSGEQLVYMEHFANENDLVANLGIIDKDEDGNTLVDEGFDGPVFVREGGWGHLLGEHYLYAMDSAEEQNAWGDLSQSRLFSEYYSKP